VDRPWEKESARCAEQELELFKHTAPAMAAAGLLVVADDMEVCAELGAYVKAARPRMEVFGKSPYVRRTVVATKE
jgi:hypothetical protein